MHREKPKKSTSEDASTEESIAIPKATMTIMNPERVGVKKEIDLLDVEDKNELQLDILGLDSTIFWHWKRTANINGDNHQL